MTAALALTDTELDRAIEADIGALRRALGSAVQAAWHLGREAHRSQGASATWRVGVLPRHYRTHRSLRTVYKRRWGGKYGSAADLRSVHPEHWIEIGETKKSDREAGRRQSSGALPSALAILWPGLASADRQEPAMHEDDVVLVKRYAANIRVAVRSAGVEGGDGSQCRTVGDRRVEQSSASRESAA